MDDSKTFRTTSMPKCLDVLKRCSPFSRWREKAPKADEGGVAEDDTAIPSATLTRGASRLDLSRQRER